MKIDDFYYKKTGWVLAILAVIIGFMTRFILNLAAYAQFEGDQIRDAFVYLGMHHGDLPWLGPASSVGYFSLPPLYYYLVYPFTLFSLDPIWQIIPNAIFSFISIILLMYVIYLLTDQLERGKRIFAAGLGGLWWALMFQDLYMNGREWNPGPVICFFLGFAIIFHLVMNESKIIKRQEILSWIGMGISVAFLVSLHSMAWFIMPILFLVCIIWYMVKKKKYLAPLLGILASAVTLTPYWIGEFQSKFKNTLTLLQASGASANDHHSIIARINHALVVVFDMGHIVYFPDVPIVFIFTVFLILSVTAFFFLFKGKKELLGVLLITWILFILAIANFWEMIYYHYLVLIAFAPLIFFVINLVIIDTRKKVYMVMAISILLFIFFSMGVNIQYIIRYADQKFGPSRQINTWDYREIVEALPPGATVCSPNKWRLERLHYFDQAYFNKKIKYSFYCFNGMYYVHDNFYVTSQISPLIENIKYKYSGDIIQENNGYKLIFVQK